MAKKIPSVINTEDLLKIAEAPAPEGEAAIVEYKNDILTFFSTFNILTGEDKIKKTTLYSIYKVWSENPLKRSEFYRHSSSFLKDTKLNGTTAYLINQNAIKLTHAAYKEFNKESIRLKSKFWTKHSQNFLDYYLLKAGTFWLEDELLFFIYDKYAYELKIPDNHAMRASIFYAYMDLFLPHKLTKTGKVYGLTDNVANQFQKDQLERMRKAYGKEKNKT